MASLEDWQPLAIFALVLQMTQLPVSSSVQSEFLLQFERDFLFHSLGSVRNQ